MYREEEKKGWRGRREGHPLGNESSGTYDKKGATPPAATLRDRHEPGGVCMRRHSRPFFHEEENGLCTRAFDPFSNHNKIKPKSPMRQHLPTIGMKYNLVSFPPPPRTKKKVPPPRDFRRA